MNLKHSMSGGIYEGKAAMGEDVKMLISDSACGAEYEN